MQLASYFLMTGHISYDMLLELFCFPTMIVIVDTFLQTLASTNWRLRRKLIVELSSQPMDQAHTRVEPLLVAWRQSTNGLNMVSDAT